jgi:hypothetical protein
MKDDFELENKALQPNENKSKEKEHVPRGGAAATVRVRIKPGRAVEGLGEAGSEHDVDPKEAKRLERIGYVEIL